MRKLGILLVLSAATMSFSGCAWRDLGPCYGVGCPAFTMSNNGSGQKSATAKTPATKSRHNKKPQNAKTAQPQPNSGQ